MKIIHYLYGLFLMLGLMAWDGAAKAEQPLLGPMPAHVVRVIDGDTVKMRVAIWINQELTVSVRVAGIDAPELFRSQCSTEKALALKAKAFVEEFLSNGEAILHEIKRDKYGGRIVARIESGGRDLGRALVAANLAVETKTRSWCS